MIQEIVWFWARFQENKSMFLYILLLPNCGFNSYLGSINLKHYQENKYAFPAGVWVMALNKCKIWHSYKRELNKTNKEMVETDCLQINTKWCKHSAPALFSEIQELTSKGSWAGYVEWYREVLLWKIDDWIQVPRKLSLAEGHSSLFAEHIIPWGFCFFFFSFFSSVAWEVFWIQLPFGL